LKKLIKHLCALLYQQLFNFLQRYFWRDYEIISVFSFNLHVFDITYSTYTISVACLSTFYFFLYTAVRHDDTSTSYFPRVFFATVIVYYRRTGRTMLIAKSIFFRAPDASGVLQRRHLQATKP